MAEERRLTRKIVELLSGQEFGGRRFELEPFLYEDHVPAIVGQAAQLAVDYYLGRAAETDIYIGILWTKLGSPALIRDRRHEAGTLYEFQDAYASFLRTGRPRMLLYRCVRPAPGHVNPASLAKVEGFFQQFRGEHANFEGLPKRYTGAEEFAGYLEHDLRVLLNDMGRKGAGLVATNGTSSGLAGRHATLLESVQSFLSNFEDLFGQGREREAGFTVRFGPMADPADPGRAVPTAELPEPGTSLSDVYQRWGRRVLLIGGAGSGKTFAMLSLMQDLVDRARQNSSGEIPVYFNLASWIPTRSAAAGGGSLFSSLRRVLGLHDLQASPTLDGWLTDELVRRYSVPRKAAKGLIDNRQIIFCLDGLDELVPGEPGPADEAAVAGSSTTAATLALRAECVARINRTLADLSVQMVLCCRDGAHQQLPIKPRLGFPLEVQPLTSEDGIRHLSEWASLDGLRGAFAVSDVLRQRARVPLFLRMMAVAYGGIGTEAILEAAAQPEQDWESHLLDHYVRQCMAVAPSSTDAYTKQQIPRFLEWLARRPDNEFLLEDMQPSLLSLAAPTSGQNWYGLYKWLAAGALALFMALSAAIPSGAASGVEWSAILGARGGMAHGLKAGLASGALTFAFTLPAFATKRWWVFGLLTGIGFATVRGVNVAFSPVERFTGSIADGLRAAAATAPCTIVVFMLFGSQTLGKIEQYKQRYRGRFGVDRFEIQPLEAIEWRWFDRSSWWRGGWLGLVIGPAVGILFWHFFDPARGVSFGLFATLFVAIFSGLSGSTLR